MSTLKLTNTPDGLRYARALVGSKVRGAPMMPDGGTLLCATDRIVVFSHHDGVISQFSVVELPLNGLQLCPFVAMREGLRVVGCNYYRGGADIHGKISAIGAIGTESEFTIHKGGHNTGIRYEPRPLGTINPRRGGCGDSMIIKLWGDENYHVGCDFGSGDGDMTSVMRDAVNAAGKYVPYGMAIKTPHQRSKAERKARAKSKAARKARRKQR